ncbi:GntR family transcriptional regulator [Bacillus halotolerans]|uniref:Crp/Fnr family transcriptional regulator n=1 Tax=Bacillus inaquosorum KCTC 13429 TaxID=1236548 RepID=A0A9W5LGH6_9BACI|nr:MULTISPECIES: FadR/GntR family transcriptional regulator [Bacillus subtilis group]RKQ21766.1 FadR family transcriptional regulator [Bacillus subtilis]AWM15869.1 FadR family transcriptional regulator [Bacillus inaquosorum]ELS60284.1 Crp/Fnr family transcriptional regulator [Bacillus inaquosorum KCTC 13429]MBU5247781.1 FadR family transcriptional regulator [Bacillus halotolerans]MCM3355088.1 FadR family transcriptional regulator [Bacillus halotolerans]
MLQKTNRQTLVEQVALQMESLIESGKWGVGMRIPAEPELMNELNVSRNTLREAIRALIHAGLLKTKQGDGTYVCSSSALGVVLKKRILRSDTLQTLEVRYALEREGAHLAAQRRTDDEARELLLQLERCEAAAELGNIDGFVTADIHLHQSIVKASHNEILIEIYNHIAEALQDSITSLTRYEVDVDFLEMHRQLVEAIVGQDADRAVEAVHRYIQESKDVIAVEEGERP